MNRKFIYFIVTFISVNINRSQTKQSLIYPRNFTLVDIGVLEYSSIAISDEPGNSIQVLEHGWSYHSDEPGNSKYWSMVGHIIVTVVNLATPSTGSWLVISQW